MKKVPLLLVFGLFFSFLKSSGQVINFPDPILNGVLLSANTSNNIAQSEFEVPMVIDQNGNGQIEITEAQAVYRLNINGYSISDLTGLSHFTNLTRLDCYYNFISILDVSPFTNLQRLDCYGNFITTIQFGENTALTEINCSNNQLTSLNLSNLPNLWEFYCDYNNLQTLSIPDSSTLYRFSCNNNQLSSLSIGNCSNLAYLYCSNNLLTSLNITGLSSLFWFESNHNLLTEIDLSGLDNPIYFECTHNLLTYFEINNVYGGSNIYLDNNLLTSFRSKNNNLDYVSFQNNPNLTFICCDNTELTLFQDLANLAGLVNCYITSNCSPEFFEPTIRGVFKYDATSNGCDATDAIVTDVKLRFDRSSVIRPFYAFNSAPLPLLFFNAFYTLTPVFENQNYFTVTPPSIDLNLYQTAPSTIVRNFCIAPNGTHADLEAVVLPISDAMLGQDATYKIVYKNKGTHEQSGTIIFTFPDNVSDLVAANPSFSGQTANTLTWDFSDLLPFESREITVVLHLNSSSDVPPLNNGSIINFGAVVSSANSDETPSDNSFNLNQMVDNSPTSNSTICLQGDSIPLSAVGQYVHYLIRFENNTNSVSPSIYLKDIIDITKLDINSIVPISSSHLGNASVPELYYNGLEVRYKNINLPFDDNANDGYFAFKIKTLPTLVQGTTFTNSAQVYFWEIPPFTTDTATTFVGSLGEMENNYENNVGFYPNPATYQITFSQSIKSVVVYTLDGKSIPTQLENNTVDVSRLSSGVYIIQITDENDSRMTQKLIKD
jgi:Secretion system C-terminal sorting domain/Domain of unknown function DUF11